MVKVDTVATTPVTIGTTEHQVVVVILVKDEASDLMVVSRREDEVRANLEITRGCTSIWGRVMTSPGWEMYLTIAVQTMFLTFSLTSALAGRPFCPEDYLNLQYTT